MTSIATQFEFTFDLYKKALRLHYKQSVGALIYRGICLWLFPALALTCFAAWVYLNAKQQQDSASTALTLGIVFSIWYSVALIAIWFRTRRAYKARFPANAISRLTTVELAAEGIAISISEAFSSKLTWDSVSKWVEDDRFFLFYINKSRFMPIPKAELSGEDAEAVRAWLQMNVKGR